MVRQFLFSLLLLGSTCLIAQDKETAADTAWKTQYRSTPERLHDLVHTRLEVKPDYDKSYLYGKAQLTLSPHFYSTDSLILDAKGMEIKELAQMKPGGSRQTLPYTYDGWLLRIRLDRTYQKGEKFTVYINYIAKPDEFEAKHGNKLLGIKGLYFINPKGTEPNKPTQIWTQGETESSSAWFPTIDKTNQRTSQEMYMTVPSRFVTLSNGKLMSQKTNADGTRTDYWKQDLPHAPYLFFMGVGDYAIVKDSWRGKEVNYYVEKEYGPVAKRIFGNTPEMMTYFSRITGVDYPWVKYSQITGRDYVAGAMENTTATIHQEGSQQDARELVDGNSWEGTIAHELFHQWFGDYVTCENWTNLTLNESFANYSELLWAEYKYGRDAGDWEQYSSMQQYLQSSSEKKDLVRFHYSSHEDMFDAVSYQKGGRVLHMLRNYVGDSAFFKSLNHYLTTHKFKSAEVHDLRLSFEEVTGRDLNWFFDQWYFGSGHPKLDIHYSYDEGTKKVRILVKQTQSGGKIFRLPAAVDIYQGATKTRRMVWVEHAVDSFFFDAVSRPDLVNFDGDKILLCEKKENKSLDNYIHQYTHAGKYLDRREAVDFFGRKLDDPRAVEALKKAMKDPYYRIRNLALTKLDLKRPGIKTDMEASLVEIARNDKHPVVRSRAIGLLGTYKNPAHRNMFETATRDSSYSVSGQALEALFGVDSARAVSLASTLLKSPAKGDLESAINRVLVKAGNPEIYDRMMTKFSGLGLSNTKFEMLMPLADMLGGMSDADKFRKGIDEIVKFREAVPENFKGQTDPYINGALTGILGKQTEAGRTALADYVKSKLPK